MRTCALLLASVFVWACAAQGQATGFFAPLDDFWGNVFAANTWAWSASTQWNGFFPPGYPTVLSVLPGSRLVESAFFFNVLLGVALMLTVWVSARRLSAEPTALASMALVAIHPVVLTQVLTTGADALLVALAVAGALALFHSVTGATPSVYLAALAGVLLALSGWVRYHGFVFSGAALVAALLVGGRPALWRVCVAAVPVALSGGLLIALGVVAGDPAKMQRAQAFNVYKGLVGPVNWFHLDAAALPKTVGEAIARDPEAFWRNYFTVTAPHLWLLVAVAIAVVVSSGRVRRFAVFVVTCGIVFIPIVNVGASPRGIAPLVPLVLVAVALAASEVVSRLSVRTHRRMAASAIVAAVSVYVVSVWLPPTRDLVSSTRFRAQVAMQIEEKLRAEHVRFGAQVFADNDFYFVHAEGWQAATYHPRVLGGWPSLDLAGYEESYPPPSTESLDRFLDDCQKVGVTHLVLTSAATLVFPDLGRVVSGALVSTRLVDVPALPGVRIFRLVA